MWGALGKSLFQVSVIQRRVEDAVCNVIAADNQRSELEVGDVIFELAVEAVEVEEVRLGVIGEKTERLALVRWEWGNQK